VDENQAKGFAMAISPLYIPAFSIEDVILDKDTGAPLAGGQVYFEEDNQRGILKPVYQITGTSPNYTFTQLPNPMTLSSIGTFEDALGNPVVPYFFPYDSEGNPDYYYVAVYSAGGVLQFDRESVPYLGESSNVDVLSVITNELSNPQFVVVNFNTKTPSYTYNFNAVSSQVVNIAPNWDMIVTSPGAGTLTLTQLTPAGTLNVVTNPATILNISSTGLSSLILRQRLFGSPNLWGNGFISGSFVAKTYSGTSVTLGMFYSQSNGTVTAQPIVSALLPSSGNYTQFSGSSQLIPISNSSDDFPNAYIDIYFVLPVSIEIDLTSIMAAYTGQTPINNIDYDQESKSRQIDHMYHNAYPVVPVGTVVDYYGFGTPLHYILCNGAAVNRVQYQQLFRALTNIETITLSNVSANITVANGALYGINTPVEGTGIPAATTITAISGNTVTLSNTPTVTGAQQITFFSVLNGDGSTTFNLPSLAGYVLAGYGGTLFSGAGISNGIGQEGGAATHAITIAEMPAHNHPGSSGTIQVGSGGGGTLPTAANLSAITTNPVTVTVASQGGGSAMSLVQPTALVQKMIRYE
jgi:microcystin-dependent protein